MKYSMVLGEAFYQIGLSQADADLVDVHFTASAHHFLLLPICGTLDVQRFHLRRHRAHLQALKEIVYLRGDFVNAKDESLRGLEDRGNWDPALNVDLVDPRMFASMNTDRSLKIGEPHPCDCYLVQTELGEQEPIRLTS